MEGRLASLGWVDFDLCCSTLCQVLSGLLLNWQKRLSRWASEAKMVEHPKSESTQPRFSRRWATLNAGLETNLCCLLHKF